MRDGQSTRALSRALDVWLRRHARDVVRRRHGDLRIRRGQAVRSGCSWGVSCSSSRRSPRLARVGEPVDKNVDFSWDDRAAPDPAPQRRVELPFRQWGVAAAIVRPLGISAAGTPFGRIWVDRDGVTVRGFLGRTRRFPRAFTHISAAKGVLVQGNRLRSDEVDGEVVFFPYGGEASLSRALKLAGFR